MDKAIVVIAAACACLAVARGVVPRVGRWLDDDWRNGWCSLECWADEGQCGPCRECLAHRHGRRR